MQSKATSSVRADAAYDSLGFYDTAVERLGSHDSEGEGDRTATIEE